MASPVIPWEANANTTIFLVALLVDVASVAACSYMLVRLLQLPSALRQRLFPRELMHLVSADLLGSLGDSTFDVLNLTQATMPSQWRDVYCAGAVSTTWTFKMASILFELHIAVSFALSQSRSPWASVAIKVLPWLWLVAIVVTWGSNALSRFFGNAWESSGTYCAPGTLKNYTLFGFACVCFTTTLLTYAYASFHARESIGSAQRRIWRRTSLYMLSFIITGVPAVMFFAFVNYSDPLVAGVAIILDHSNGFVNFLAYAASSKYSRRAPTVKQTSSQDQGVSWRAEMDDAAIEIYSFEVSVPADSLRASTSTLAGLADSLRVPSLTISGIVPGIPASGSTLDNCRDHNTLFHVGDFVEACNNKGVWRQGQVVSTVPLRVQPVGWHSAQTWDHYQEIIKTPAA